MSEASRVYEPFEVKAIVKGLLSDTLRDIMTILKAECGSIFLFDGNTQELILDSYYNSHRSESFQGVKRKVGEGIAGKVMDSRKPVLVQDISADSRFNRNGFNHYSTNSFISLPLFGSRELLGVINIADKANGEPFSEKDLQFAVTLSRYACMLADNILHSERLKIEKEAYHKQKVILEKYASVGKLAAGIVHEVNNPLDGIIRYTNMLLHTMESNSIAKEYLLEIKKGLNRIANITRSLLEFSRQVNQDAVKSVKKFVEVEKLIEDCLEMFKDKIKDTVKVEQQIAASLPKVLDIGIIHIFLNIIKNAIDAMPEGGSLKISACMQDGFLKVWFQDSGLGIPNEIKSRIFEPFFTTKSIDKGTGLGLSICKEIVTKYEGQIAVESNQGEGSTFTILLPKKYLYAENV